MRYSRAARVLVVCATFGTCIATAQASWGPSSNEELRLTLRAGLSPKALPRQARAPAAIELAAGLQADGVPPVLRKLELRLGRDAAVDVEGVPECVLGERAIDYTLDTIGRICGSAVVGGGSLTVMFAFPENTPITIPSKLLIINRGEEGGVVDLQAIAAFRDPIEAFVIIPIEVENRGGLRATLSVPPISNGHGHPLEIKLVLGRAPAPGNAGSILRLRCRDGRLALSVRAHFPGDTSLGVRRPLACKEKQTGSQGR